MNKIEPKQEELTVYSKVALNKLLKDVRVNTYGFKFGTVESICKQFGIKYKVLSDCVEFKAPKLRLQMLIEKLHFSKTGYFYGDN